MWMSIMILCGSVYAQSCMVITGNVLFPNKDACFEDSIKKAIVKLAEGDKIDFYDNL